jgi:hypothetical protein
VGVVYGIREKVRRETRTERRNPVRTEWNSEDGLTLVEEILNLAAGDRGEAPALCSGS